MDVARSETAVPAKKHKLYLQMEVKFDDADVCLEIIDGKFNIAIDGEVQALKTQLFKMFDPKRLVLAGGSVAAICYALYRCGYTAHSFFRKCLQYTLDLSEDEIPVVQKKIKSGDFQRVLYKKTMEIIKEYEMTRLEDLTFGSVWFVENVAAYPMNKKVGKVYIFNFTKFKDHHEERTGSENDVKGLKEVFRKMGFRANSLDNRTYSEFRNNLDEIAGKDFKNYESLVMIFLSHGDDDNIEVTDGEFPRKKILEKFRGERVQSLVGKPKLFIFQTCHGMRRETAVPESVECTDECTDTLGFNPDRVDTKGDAQILEAGVQMPTLPGGSEFLICNAANKGFVSYRSAKNGSRYIQTLVKVLDEYYEGKIDKETDVVRLLTLVSSRVAAMNDPKGKSPSAKQMPAFTSTLTKLFILPRNENQSRLEPQPKRRRLESQPTSSACEVSDSH